MAEAQWVTMRRRAFEPLRADDADLPMVSVQVPSYDEPPEMLKETLDALARLDYPRFEVLVIDNNTPDEATWKPSKHTARDSGSRFRFFHVSPLPVSRPAPSTSRYAIPRQRRRWWRSSTATTWWTRTGCVISPRCSPIPDGVVQAPQDYRDADGNAFKAMCHAEYRGFFYIGMITRNERNAIIQHGTMTMIRRRVLEQVGAWSEWCITEDAELGLKVFEAGYEAAYIPRSYGGGLMPDTLLDYKKQRFRWAYGAVQILKHHSRSLFGKSGLTLGQRYHFLAGWLPWLSDGFNLVFNIAAMGWSVAMAMFPSSIDPPLMIFSALRWPCSCSSW